MGWGSAKHEMRKETNSRKEKATALFHFLIDASLRITSPVHIPLLPNPHNDGPRPIKAQVTNPLVAAHR